MQYRSKKLLSLLLAVLMIMSLLPSAAFATEGDDIEPVEIAEPATDNPDVEEEAVVDGGDVNESDSPEAGLGGEGEQAPAEPTEPTEPTEGEGNEGNDATEPAVTEEVEEEDLSPVVISNGTDEDEGDEADDDNTSTGTDFAAFLNMLDTTGNSVTFDGSKATGAVDGKLTVTWSPVTGECQTNSTGNTPAKVNNNNAQYIILSGKTDVTIKNVNFVYVPADFNLTGNTGNAGSFTKDNVKTAQLYLENTGNTTIENCSFNGIIFTSWCNTGNTTISGCSFSNIYNAYAIKDLGGATASVTNCTFEDCGGGIMTNSNSSRASVSTALTISNNTFTNIDVEGTAASGKAGSRGVIQIAENTTLSALTIGTGTNANTATGCGPILRQLNQNAVSLVADNLSALEALAGTGSLSVEGSYMPTGTEVSSLDALKTAIANGGEIKLIADIDLSTATSFSKAVTIDLNGHKLTVSNGVNYVSANVTFKDTAAAKGSFVLAPQLTAADGVFVIPADSSNVTMTFDGVNVTGENYSSCYALFHTHSATSKIVVNGGTWNLSGEKSSTGGVFKQSSCTGATLSINNATMELTNVSRVTTEIDTSITGSNITIKGDGTANMEHGFNKADLTITNSNVTIDGLHGRAITAGSGQTVSITGSTVTITDCTEATIQAYTASTFNVSDSTVTVDKSPVDGSITPATTTIEGVTVATVPADAVAKIGTTGYSSILAALAAVKDNETIVINAGSYTLGDLSHFHFTAAETTANDGTAPKGVTIKAAEGATVKLDGFYFNNRSFPENLTIEGITFDGSLKTTPSGWCGGIYSQTDAVGLTVEKCSFVNGAYLSLTTATGHKNIKVDSCTFSDVAYTDALKATAITIHNVDGLTVTGCTFTNPGHNAIQLSNTASGNITISNNSISGTHDRALRLTTLAESTTVSITGNTITNSADSNGEVFKVNTVNSGATVTFSSNTYDGINWNPDQITTTDTEVAYKVPYEAKIGETTYTTLTAAAEAAQPGDTITLLEDAQGNGIVVAENTFTSGLTLDLNGHTYDINPGMVGSEGTKTNGFQLNKGNTITIKNGTIKSTAACATLIQNYCDLTLTDVTLDLTTTTWDDATTSRPSFYVLSNNCGTVSINGSTSIKAPVNKTIGGQVAPAYAFDACKFGSYDAPTVTLNTTGTIEGTVEVTGGALTVEQGTVTVSLQSGSVKDSTGESSTVTVKAADGYVLNKNDETNTYTATKAVAKVNDTLYTDFAAAVAALNESADATLTLLADVATESITTISAANVTFDGNGHSLVRTNNEGGANGTTTLYFTGKNPTVKNLTVNTDETNGLYGIWFNACGNSTMENVTVKGTYLDTKGYSSTNAVAFGGTGGGTMKDCDVPGVFKNGNGGSQQLKLENSKIDNLYFNYTGASDSELYGIGVTAADGDKSEIGNLVLGYGNTDRISPNVLKNADNVQTAVALVTYGNGHATIAEGKTDIFFTLPDAVAAVAGQTGAPRIDLLCDATGAGVVFEEGKHTALTIDFNGFTYTIEGSKGHGLVGSGSQFEYSDDRNTQTNGFQILKENTVKLKNGTLKMHSLDNLNGTHTENMVIINYSALTLDSFNLIGDEYTNYVLSNNNDHTQITGNSSITAVMDGACAFDVDYKANAYPNGVSVTVNTTGTITGNIEVERNAKASLTIEGGTFVGEIKPDLPKGAEEVDAKIAISGGIFDHAIEADWCAAGYAPVTLTNDLYGVKTDYAARIGDKTYTTLEAAFAEATTGDTIEVLKDLNTTEILCFTNVADGLIVDFGGHTITSTLEKAAPGNKNSTLRFENAKNLTIKNLTLKGTGYSGINLVSCSNTTLENVSVLGDYFDGYGHTDLYAVTFTNGGGGTMINCTVNGTVFKNGQALVNDTTDGRLTLKDSTIASLYVNAPTSVVNYKDYTVVLLDEGDRFTTLGKLYCADPTSFRVSGDVVAKANEVYLVSGDDYVAPVAKIGDVLYATLKGAVDAAENGNNINLLAPTAESIAVGKAITIIGYGDNKAKNLSAATGYEMTTNIRDGINLYYFTAKSQTPVEEPVAEIKLDDGTTTQYTTVKAALDAATSGQTVTMIADSTESGKNLVIPAGVTLDLGKYTLTAASLTGLKDSCVTGTTYNTSGNRYAKLVVDADSLRLSETPATVSFSGSSYNVLPIFDPSTNCYVLSLYNIYYEASNQDCVFTVENNTICFDFSQMVSGAVQSNLLTSKYSSQNNKYTVAVTVSWQNNNGTYNQTYVYKDAFVQYVSNVNYTNRYYTFTLTGFSALGLNDSNMNTLQVQAKVITDSGVVSALSPQS